MHPVIEFLLPVLTYFRISAMHEIVLSRVFTTDRMKTMASPIKTVSYGKVSFCANYRNDHVARFPVPTSKFHRMGKTTYSNNENTLACKA